MATAIHVDIVDEDGSIYVSHTFWGETETEAREHFEAHARECKYFRTAIADDRVIEDTEHHVERPEVEEEPEGEEFDEDEGDEEDDAA